MSRSTTTYLKSKDLAALTNALNRIAYDWWKLGLNLKLNQDKLSTISQDHTNHGAETCLREMLNKWLQTNRYATWKDIYFAVQKIERMDVANEIACDHGLLPTAHVSGPTIVRVGLGKEVSLTCEAKGELPLKYQWYRGDQPMQKTCPEYNGTFKIPSVSKKNEGHYHCKVTNEFGSMESKNVELIIGEKFEATHLLTVFNYKDTDMDVFFHVATHLAQDSQFAIFYQAWEEQDEHPCSWTKLADALGKMKNNKKLADQCKEYKGKELNKKIFHELVEGKVDAKQLKEHLIPSGSSADVGEEGGSVDKSVSVDGLFEEWNKFQPSWVALVEALLHMPVADETTAIGEKAATYAGKKLNQSSFSDLLKNSNPPVKLEELWQKLNIKESSKFRSSFIRKLKIWDECSNPWKAWKELAASIESMPATPKELRYSLGTKVRLAAGIGHEVNSENVSKAIKHAKCDGQLKAIVKTILKPNALEKVWNGFYSTFFTEDPYDSLMTKWPTKSWEGLARAAEQSDENNGFSFAQGIRAFSGAGGYPEVASVFTDSDETILEIGKKVTFTCSARGAAPLHYTWMRDDEPLPGQQKPEMTLTVTKGGNYYCVVKNELGSKNSGLIEIKVGKRPKCRIYFKEKECGSSLCIKRQTKQVKLTCKVIEGSPDFEFTWKFNGVEKQGVKGPKCYSLEIGEATEDNKGTYKCTVSNGIGQPHTSEVEVDVGDPPEIKVTAIEGVKRSNFEVKTEVTICCEATGTAPLGYTWWQWHSNHTMRTEHQGGAKLKVVTAEDKEGDYECEVSNKFGVATSTPPVKIIVGSAPVIKSKPRIDGELMHGKRVTLSCKAEEGKLPIKFEWLLNNQLLEKTPLNKEKESELVIESLSDSDQGEYKCKAFNAFGFDVSSSVQLELNISHGDIMPLIEEKVAAKWYAFGLLLGVPKDTLDSIARGYVASFGDSEYALSEVVRDWLEDKHTQESSKPKSWSSLQEVVEKMGYRKLAGDIESKEPSIRSIMTNEVVKLKNPVTISCEASGWDIGYEWKHNGRTLVKETQKHLVIESVTEQHQGTYQCCVQNRFGKDKNSIDLKFNGKPNKIIKDPKKKKNNAEGQVATKHTTEEMGKYFQKLCEEIKKILNQTTGDHDTAFSSGWASLYLITKDILVPEEREKIQDINSLFDVFSPYWNFRRLHLLKTVVTQFGNETAEEKMETYSQQLSDYEAYTTVHQFTCALERGKITLPAVPDSVSQFSFTLESLWSSCFVKDVDRLLSYLLPSQVSHDFVLFSNAKEDGDSHVTVNYLVSKSMAEALTTGVTEKSSNFSSSGILSVKVNDCPIEPKVIQPVHPQLIGLPLPTAQEPEPKEEQPTPQQIKLELQVQQLQEQLNKLSENFCNLGKKVDSQKDKFHDEALKQLALKNDFENQKKEFSQTKKVAEKASEVTKTLSDKQASMESQLENKVSRNQWKENMKRETDQVKRETEHVRKETEQVKRELTLMLNNLEAKVDSYKTEVKDDHKQRLERLEKHYDEMWRGIYALKTTVPVAELLRDAMRQ